MGAAFLPCLTGIAFPKQGEHAMTNDLLSAALVYAGRGWPVVPDHTPILDGDRCHMCRLSGRQTCPHLCSCADFRDCTKGKHPRIMNGIHGASTDPALIERWWSMWPAANVAVRTGRESGLLVLDIEAGGREDLAALECDLGPLPLGREHASGGDGMHLVCRYPDDASYIKSGTLAGLVEVKADGAKVTMPPSLHETGKRYGVTVDGDLIELPTAWVRYLLAKLASKAPAPGEKASGDPNASVDLVGRTLAAGGIEHRRRERPGEFFAVWELNECPFAEHRRSPKGKAYVAVLHCGAVAAGCQAGKCDWGWKELRKHCDPDRTQRGKAPAGAGGGEAEHDFGGAPFLISGGRICWRKDGKDGPVIIPLCNFIARVEADVTRDDGAEAVRRFRVAGKLADGRKLPAIDVPCARFSSLSWVTAGWGVDAIVSSGMGAQDRLREAILHLSQGASREMTYTHVGWRQVDGAKWCYLHAGGAIGVNGAAEVAVDLDSRLSRYELSVPATPAELAAAVQASLRVLDVAPLRVTVPLLGAVYRAVLGAADFSLWLAGPTGAGKSELAALAQQHYGAGMDSRHLPESWSSTANSLETTAFLCKDALLTVDDFKPSGSRIDVQRMHGAAERVLRGQGNRQGRGRCRQDGTTAPVKPPRGLILATAEDLPKGESLASRTLIVEVNGRLGSPRSSVKLPVLTELQGAARDGKLAAALGGFVRWLAPQLEAVRAHFAERVIELRDQALNGGHPRTPEIVGQLAAVLDLVFDFAVEAGALSAEVATQRWQDCWSALIEAADEHGSNIKAQDPVTVYLGALSSAIASGAAHVAGMDGNEPDPAASACWGWRSEVIGTGRFQRVEWQPQGRRIGWVDGDDLYLEPRAAFGVATRVLSDGDESVGASETTMRKRLGERGLLRSTGKSAGRETLAVQKTIEGGRKTVLHLASDVLIGSIPPSKT